MLDIAGKGRIVKLFVTIGIAVGVWSYGFTIFGTQLKEAEDEYHAQLTKSQKYQEDIKKLNNVAKLMALRGDEYTQVVDKGVREEQNRIIARRDIQEARLATDIPFLNYRISQEREKTDTFINQRGYQLFESEVFFDMQAYTGYDIFNFVDKLKKDFNGHLILKRIVIEKRDDADKGSDVMANTTSALAQSLVAPRLQAKITYTWSSLKQKQVDKNDSDMVDF